MKVTYNGKDKKATLVNTNTAVYIKVGSDKFPINSYTYDNGVAMHRMELAEYGV